MKTKSCFVPVRLKLLDGSIGKNNTFYHFQMVQFRWKKGDLCSPLLGSTFLEVVEDFCAHFFVHTGWSSKETLSRVKMKTIIHTSMIFWIFYWDKRCPLLILTLSLVPCPSENIGRLTVCRMAWPDGDFGRGYIVAGTGVHYWFGADIASPLNGVSLSFL